MTTSDFDFLVGSWDIEHSSLVDLLAGSDRWRTVRNSTADAWRHVDGAVSIDEIAVPELGWSGMSLRLFAPETREWSIWWLGSRDGLLGSPVYGRWQDGVGRLVGDDLHDGTAEGTPIRCRYLWTGITADAARWEQALSTDGGASWETNAIWELSRTA